jgi:hypothetical protein
LPIPIASSVFPTLFFTSFKALDLILRSLIQCELILVLGERHGSNFSFLQAENHFSQQHLLTRLSFLHSVFLASLSKNKVCIAVWIHIWVLYSVSFVFMSVFVLGPCCF